MPVAGEATRPIRPGNPTAYSSEGRNIAGLGIASLTKKFEPTTYGTR